MRFLSCLGIVVMPFSYSDALAMPRRSFLDNIAQGAAAAAVFGTPLSPAYASEDLQNEAILANLGASAQQESGGGPFSQSAMNLASAEVDAPEKKPEVADKPKPAPEVKAADKPAEKPKPPPEAKAADKPAEKPKPPPEAKAADKPAEKPKPPPEAKAADKPAEKPKPAPEVKAAEKPKPTPTPEKPKPTPSLEKQVADSVQKTFGPNARFTPPSNVKVFTRKALNGGATISVNGKPVEVKIVETAGGTLKLQLKNPNLKPADLADNIISIKLEEPQPFWAKLGSSRDALKKTGDNAKKGIEEARKSLTASDKPKRAQPGNTGNKEISPAEIVAGGAFASFVAFVSKAAYDRYETDGSYEGLERRRREMAARRDRWESENQSAVKDMTRMLEKKRAEEARYQGQGQGRYQQSSSWNGNSRRDDQRRTRETQRMIEDSQRREANAIRAEERRFEAEQARRVSEQRRQNDYYNRNNNNFTTQRSNNNNNFNTQRSNNNNIFNTQRSNNNNNFNDNFSSTRRANNKNNLSNTQKSRQSKWNQRQQERKMEERRRQNDYYSDSNYGNNGYNGSQQYANSYNGKKSQQYTDTGYTPKKTQTNPWVQREMDEQRRQTDFFDNNNFSDDAYNGMTSPQNNKYGTGNGYTSTPQNQRDQQQNYQRNGRRDSFQSYGSDSYTEEDKPRDRKYESAGPFKPIGAQRDRPDFKGNYYIE